MLALHTSETEREVRFISPKVVKDLDRFAITTVASVLCVCVRCVGICVCVITTLMRVRKMNSVNWPGNTDMTVPVNHSMRLTNYYYC